MYRCMLDKSLMELVMKNSYKIGLVAEQPNIEFEDVHKSLAPHFQVVKVDPSQAELTTCDLYVYPTSNPSPDTVSRLAKRLLSKGQLVVVSQSYREMKADTNKGVFYYPYNFEIITNLPLLINTIVNACQMSV